MTAIDHNRPVRKLSNTHRAQVIRKQDGLYKRLEKEAGMTKLELEQQHRQDKTKNKLRRKLKAGNVEPPPTDEKLAYLAAKEELSVVEPSCSDLVARLPSLLDVGAQEEEEKRLKREDKAHLAWMYSIMIEYVCLSA